SVPSHSSTLSLHDALPISITECFSSVGGQQHKVIFKQSFQNLIRPITQHLSRSSHHLPMQRGGILLINIGNSHGRQKPCPETLRSEEHTSELQSRFDLVCR